MTISFSMRHLLAALVPLLVATAPPLPSGIAPYVHDNRLEPGDYRWLRGKFDGASATELATYRAMTEWRRRCRVSDMAETRADLTRLEVKAGASLDTIPYRSLLCDQFAIEPEPLDLHDWAGFARDVTTVLPVAQGFLAAVSMGEETAEGGGTDLRDILNAKTVGEQMLRGGMSWASEPSTPHAPTLTLTPQQRGILVSELAIALAVRDHANTAWLKGIIAARGWPKRSQVGDKAARMTWLLVQHADADPAFQVRALRLMEPLVPSGEDDRKNYAYLYDRVMLKLVGKQRYATQLTCLHRQLVPQPLEDEQRVDTWRRRAGMETLAEYKARALRDTGPCPDDPATE